MKEQELRNFVRKMHENQRLGVLVSRRGIYPYPTLVAFYNSPDLSTIICATSVNTRKYENITKNPHISFMINNAQNAPDDVSVSSVITAFGIATCSERDEDINDIISNLEKKHPVLLDFFRAPSTRFILMHVERYQIVSQFQNVQELIP